MPAAYIIYTYIHITHIHTQRTRRNISIYNIYTIYIRTGSGELLEGKTASAVTIVTPLVLNPISVRSVLSPKLPVVPLLLHQPTHPSDQTTPVHRMPPETPFCLLPRRTPSGGARYATTSSPPNHQPVYIFYFTFFFFFIYVFFSRNDYLVLFTSLILRVAIFYNFFPDVFPFYPRACRAGGDVFHRQFIFCYFLDFCGLSRILEQSILRSRGGKKERDKEKKQEICSYECACTRI